MIRNNAEVLLHVQIMLFFRTVIQLTFSLNSMTSLQFLKVCNGNQMQTLRKLTCSLTQIKITSSLSYSWSQKGGKNKISLSTWDFYKDFLEKRPNFLGIQWRKTDLETQRHEKHLQKKQVNKWSSTALQLVSNAIASTYNNNYNKKNIIRCKG